MLSVSVSVQCVCLYTKLWLLQIHVVHEVTSDSSDSDVIILPSDDTQPPSTTRGQRPCAVHPRSRSPVAGPSRVCYTLNVALS